MGWWTPERDDVVRAWARGEIEWRQASEALGRDVTKDKVVGRAWRLGLQRRAHQRGFLERMNEMQRMTPRGCAYIIGEIPGPDWHFCNAPRVEGRPWCALHRDACISLVLTHQPPVRKVRRA